MLIKVTNKFDHRSFWVILSFKIGKLRRLKLYRPGQPNWEDTMLKFINFPVTQILRKIYVGHFEAPKTAIITIWAALNYEFLGTFDIFQYESYSKIKIQSLQNDYNDTFWLSKFSQNWFHVKKGFKKIAKFQHCGQ